jgi:hypothetical protein
LTSKIGKSGEGSGERHSVSVPVLLQATPARWGITRGWPACLTCLRHTTWLWAGGKPSSSADRCSGKKPEVAEMRLEFGAFQVWLHSDHAILAGRVHEADIVLGDVFTQLVWTPWLPVPIYGIRVGEPTVTHQIGLRVVSIEAYQHSLDFLSSGMTGALKLIGPGLELLGAVVPLARDGQWLLRGEKPAGSGATSSRPLD